MQRGSEIRFFIGIDGGGSGSRVRLCGRNGDLLGSAEGGSANVYLDFEGAMARLRSAIADACGRACIDGAEPAALALGLGLAGVSSAAVAEHVRTALGEFGSVAVANDGVIACLGAHGGPHGGLVIAGTGSVAVLCLDGAVTTFGGRGFHLGDDGSGARLGRDLCRKALRALDSLEPWTPLLRSLMADFSGDPVALIAWARGAASRDFASYAPRIFSAAQDGDAAGLALARDAARSIGELILGLRQRGAPRITLAGGLSAVLTPYLAPETGALLSPARADALSGALLLAGAPVPAEAI